MELRMGIDVLVARRTVGLSQGRLAELSGIDPSSLSRIEWSRKQLDPRRAERIERALKSAGARPDGGNEAA